MDPEAPNPDALNSRSNPQTRRQKSEARPRFPSPESRIVKLESLKVQNSNAVSVSNGTDPHASLFMAWSPTLSVPGWFCFTGCFFLFLSQVVMGVTEEEVLLDRKVFLDQKVFIRGTKPASPTAHGKVIHALSSTALSLG